LRRVQVLRQHQAARRFDLADAQAAITSSAGEHDRDRAVRPIVSERTEEMIDRKLKVFAVPRTRLEFTVDERDQFSGRCDIDGVRLDLQAILDRARRNLGVPRQQFRQQGDGVRMLMRDDAVSDATIRCHLGKELLQGLQPACRGAKSDHGDAVGRGMLLDLDRGLSRRWSRSGLRPGSIRTEAAPTLSHATA
jgi:hypothetical protein